MLEQAIRELQARQLEIAEAAMKHPNVENIGVISLSAGKWQGLQEALDILLTIARGEEDKG